MLYFRGKCECGGDFVLDDLDTTSKGNQDEYYVCNKCGMNATVIVRNGVITEISYLSKDGKIEKIDNFALF